MKKIRKIFLLIFFFFLISCSNKNTKDLFNIIFFDVNQGDSSLISYNNISILIDTGEKEFIDNVINTIKSRNIKTLDYVILTHDHSDHSSGFPEIYKNFKVNNVILPGIFKNDTFNEVKSLIKNSKTKLLYIDKPSILNLKNDFKLKFLCDFSNPVEEFNDSSLVFQASVKDFDVLYTGDIEEDKQIELLDMNIKSEILKVPHHGAYNNDKNNVKKFIEKVNPYISVISVGNNSYGHPNKNTLNILNDVNSKILRTDQLGNIIISCDMKNNTLTINSII
ncbi:ComEC/Rec2 family competence protein [Candidatus Arthromitus sp. SFB-rat-Yit]|uniref:ComEC/Rec2 family competence protein n=1 Tax=Candidatus Arthromitus sp. SFB-rat-Yit TaxID=1041504 RepID=UPI000227A568|nr:MBL fold metallo-hydrolase [Candidatus Arthromitus sp. SFB-rat-Yit]BAK81604.1 metallo-beta-lactamase domain protein [Candidatus Arthromitus sp. SFB-rat-Yit]